MIWERECDRHASWAARSHDLLGAGAVHLPGADTSTTAHFPPHPIVMESGRASRVWDVDGHEYVDFMNHHTALILGHANPAVVEAVTRQLRLGSGFGAPVEAQFQLARVLCDRIPSLQQLRFCASGSEATMMAVRAARAFTGRPRLVKIEGAYHGNHAFGGISLTPLASRAGPVDAPAAFALDAGTSEAELSDVLVAPFNDAEGAERLIREHRDDVGALIVEPLLTGIGMIPAEPGYLRDLRRICDENEVVLIFDEVVSLRLSPGGAQGLFGVVPDLTAMGKIIGGGLPLGAFGGRRAIMSAFDPGAAHHLWHATTFGGAPPSLAAGMATLQQLEPPVYEQLNRAGDELRARFNHVFETERVRGRATGIGSLVHIHLTDRPLRDARDAVDALVAAAPVPALLHLCLLRRGVFADGRLTFSISAPMTQSDIDHAVLALAGALREVLPVIQSQCPDLAL